MKKMLPVLALGLMLSLIALPVIADNVNSNANNKNKTVDLTKMQAAVDTRDTSILLAWDKYSTDVKSALEARKTALRAAWALTDRTTRRTAIKGAWTTYRNAVKSARETWRKNKKAAWTQWKIDAKAAKGNAEDNTSESVDNSL
jgi:uncharacterized protein YqgV (UPF0045/DUF77 family)